MTLFCCSLNFLSSNWFRCCKWYEKTKPSNKTKHFFTENITNISLRRRKRICNNCFGKTLNDFRIFSDFTTKLITNLVTEFHVQKSEKYVWQRICEQILNKNYRRVKRPLVLSQIVFFFFISKDMLIAIVFNVNTFQKKIARTYQI